MRAKWPTRRGGATGACALLLLVALLAARPDAGWAQGSTNTTFTTSTTRHTTHTRVDLPEEREDEFLTRLTARIAGGPALFDQSFAVPFFDAAVQAAVLDATAALIAAGLPDVLTITGPTLLSSLVALLGSTTEQVGEALDHTEETITEEISIGPGTIIIGDRDQGGTAFEVLAGTTNINENTHTESFVNDLFQMTDTFLTTEHYELVAFVQGVPAPAAGLLLAAGLAGLGALARLRRGQRSWPE